MPTTTPRAAAMPMAGAPRTRRVRIASQTSSTVRQSRYSSRVGSRVWSIRRTKPSMLPTHSMVGGACMGVSRKVEAPAAADRINPQEIFQELFSHALCVNTALDDPRRIRQGKNGEAGGRIMGLDGRFQRVGRFLIAVVGKQNQL